MINIKSKIERNIICYIVPKKERVYKNDSKTNSYRVIN